MRRHTETYTRLSTQQVVYNCLNKWQAEYFFLCDCQIDKKNLPYVWRISHRVPYAFVANSFETQRNGLVFIYDMAGSNYTNFELDLSKKILNLLKVPFFYCSLHQHIRTERPRPDSFRGSKRPYFSRVQLFCLSFFNIRGRFPPG